MSAELDFVVYLADPDEGAEALSSRALEKAVAEHKEKLEFPHVYGAVVVREGDEEITERKADPILPLVTKFTRTVPYLIDGETETVLLSESEHGFALEPAGDDVLLSFFVGDAYEPEEYLIQQMSVKMTDLGEQILSMAERMRAILEVVSPDSFEEGGDGKSLDEFIEMGREAFKTYKLELERGLRVT